MKSVIHLEPHPVYLASPLGECFVSNYLNEQLGEKFVWPNPNGDFRHSIPNSFSQLWPYHSLRFLFFFVLVFSAIPGTAPTFSDSNKWSLRSLPPSNSSSGNHNLLSEFSRARSFVCFSGNFRGLQVEFCLCSFSIFCRKLIFICFILDLNLFGLKFRIAFLCFS